jgi:hypothetical protein
MFCLSDKVRVVTNDRFNGETGIVSEVFPAGTMEREAVYTIRYDSATPPASKGMFPEPALTKISPNEGGKHE